MSLGAFGCIFMMKRENVYHENINELSGLSRNHPILALSLLIIFFSLAGIPPLAGFFAKFYIFIAVIESKMYTLAIVGLVTTVISAYYYLRIVKIIYFDRPKKEEKEEKENKFVGVPIKDIQVLPPVLPTHRPSQAFIKDENEIVLPSQDKFITGASSPGSTTMVIGSPDKKDKPVFVDKLDRRFNFEFSNIL